MFFYFIIFGISLGLFNSVVYRVNRGKDFLFHYILFLLFLSIIEGCRDLTIGTDLNVYGILFFDEACKSKDLISHISDYKGEWGFHTLMWLCSRLSKDIHIMMFVSALIKISLVSSAFIKMRNQLSPILLMFSYLCFSYVTGFNIMRQALAGAFVIFAIPYLLENKWIPYFLLSLLAMTIHSSAFMSIFLVLLFFMTKINAGMCLSFIGLGIVYFFSSSIMIYISLIDLGNYSDKAILYMEREGVKTAKVNIIIAIFYILFILKNKKFSPTDHFFKYFVILSVSSLFFTIMSSYFEVAVRLSWYILYLLSFMYLIYIRNLPNEKMYSLIYVVLFLLYFIMDAIHGLGDCLPYKSKILGI